jgi:hypothetical protein
LSKLGKNASAKDYSKIKNSAALVNLVNLAQEVSKRTAK